MRITPIKSKIKRTMRRRIHHPEPFSDRFWEGRGRREGKAGGGKGQRGGYEGREERDGWKREGKVVVEGLGFGLGGRLVWEEEEEMGVE